MPDPHTPAPGGNLGTPPTGGSAVTRDWLGDLNRTVGRAAGGSDAVAHVYAAVYAVAYPLDGAEAAIQAAGAAVRDFVRLLGERLDG